MFKCVCHSHWPPPCLSKAELPTQSTLSLFMVPLWSHCRSRSLSLMLSVNEVACIVPGAMKRRHGPALSWRALLLLLLLQPRSPFYRPVTENPGPTLIFSSACASWVRGERGGGVHRKTLSGSGLSFYCNLCKCCALLFTPDIWLLCSGSNMTVVIKDNSSN